MLDQIAVNFEATVSNSSAAMNTRSLHLAKKNLRPFGRRFPVSGMFGDCPRPAIEIPQKPILRSR